ncbi:hypothetical protein ACX93W_16985 [Paenibacillus sp. CAU 1782]
MAKTKEKFVPSINIKFDIGKDQFVEKYLPTPSHSHPLLGIANGLLNQGAKAHIVVGPYGSGKSLLGTLLANLSLKEVSKKVANQLFDRFDNISPEIGNTLRGLIAYPYKYLPVILEGNVGSFRNALLSSVQRTLDRYNIEIEVPGVAADILQRIDIWQNEFPDTFIKLQKLVSEHWDWNVWLYQIENYDQKAISWFTQTYPQLTSGAPFQITGYGDITTQLEYVLTELNKKGMGLFVVHDEFGRFLQSLETIQIHETMQDIQDVAELVNHSSLENMSLVLITHRNLRQYASRFNEELQKEFQRIEKRFHSYHVESDQATFIRLASLITTKHREKWSGPEKEVSQGLSKFPLFPELTDFEVANLVAGGSYPLHPVSLFALPRLANVVAQNERTLFTLLESDETGGLKKHLETEKSWYTIDRLFDYFEPTFEAFEVDSNVKDSYLLYKRSLRRLKPSEDNEKLMKVIKLLAIFEIGNLKTKVLPTTDFIAFSLNWSIPITTECLNVLARQKIVRFLNEEERWMLYDGSFVNVDKEIKDRMNSFSLSAREKMEITDEILEKKFYLPNEYNDEKSMTRFAVVKTIHFEEINKGTKSVDRLLLESEADFAVFLVIVENARDLDDAYRDTAVLSENSKSMIFVVPETESEELDVYIRKLKVLKMLELDKNFMSQDKFISDEMLFLRREVMYRLRQIINGYTQFQNGYIWFHEGQIKTISSDRILSKYLSNISRGIYPSTPIVKNEAYNRRNISKVQKNNAINLIDQIIDSIYNGLSEIPINGYGPDYLIYATVIKNNGIVLLQPDLLEDNCLADLRRALQAELLKENGSVKELVDVFTKRPFGIRLPVVPVLFVSLLSIEWKHLMFFKNQMYVSSLDGELLWEIIHAPEEYTFSYQEPKEEEVKLSNLIGHVFSDYKQSGDEIHQLPLQLCKMLQRWFLSLPRFSRSTLHQSKLSNKFRELVKLSEVRPHEALAGIYRLTKGGEDRKVLERLRTECEEFLEQHRINLEKRVYRIMQAESYSGIYSYANSQKSIVKQRSKLISALLVSNESNWIEQISESLVGVPRESWSDATDEVFETELENELTSITQNNYQNHYMELKSEEGSVLIPKLELSEKSQLIYENVKRTLQFTGRTVPKEELRVVLWKLLKDASSDSSNEEILIENKDLGGTR